jgi:Zn-dependent peptidase ImmA (M78 family)
VAYLQQGERLAREMGVQILTKRLAAGLDGLTLGPDRIVIHAALRGFRRQLTIAHELGHVAVQRRQYFPRSWQDEESYADAYARRVMASALPDSCSAL